MWNFCIMGWEKEKDRSLGKFVEKENLEIKIKIFFVFKLELLEVFY